MATAVLVHGLAEHGGRYASLAEPLASRGYSVAAIDLRGHGMSQGPRLYVDSFDRHLDDVGRFVEHMRTEQSQGPLFLFGHSMGGLIVALLASQRIAGIDGAAISAAPVKLDGQLFPVLRFAARPVSALLPKVRIVRLNYATVSRDPQAVAAIENDPLVCHGRIPNRTGGELLRAGAQLQRQMPDIDMPLLVLHGTGDVICDFRGAQLLHQQAGSADKTLKLYDGLYHNLLDEPEKNQVIADAMTWFDAHRG